MIGEAVLCLALNLYFEARNQSQAGQIMVGLSVMNRVKHEHYPGTVCEVVKSAKYRADNKNIPIRNACAYSWFCNSLSDKPTDLAAFSQAKIMAHRIYTNQVTDYSEGATHYHATWIEPPYWVEQMETINRIDEHIFYKERDQ